MYSYDDTYIFVIPERFCQRTDINCILNYQVPIRSYDHSPPGVPQKKRHVRVRCPLSGYSVHRRTTFQSGLLVIFVVYIAFSSPSWTQSWPSPLSRRWLSGNLFLQLSVFAPRIKLNTDVRQGSQKSQPATSSADPYPHDNFLSQPAIDQANPYILRARVPALILKAASVKDHAEYCCKHTGRTFRINSSFVLKHTVDRN